ncbi:MAG: hypothetical protein HKM05_06890 [Spirochaetales bacterium]|nr:hypothetical protein [Spirochaetales bacterium]
MDNSAFSHVLDQCPLPIEILDGTGVLLYANPYFPLYFSQDYQQFLGKTSPSLGLPAGENWWEQAKQSPLWRCSVSLPRDPGLFIDTLTVFPLTSEDGVALYILVHADTTQEVIREEAARREQGIALIRSRQVQVGDMLSMIAHEWRQPLTLINSLVGNVQLKMELGSLDQDYLREKLDKITATVQSLSQTIDTFRGFYTSLGTAKRQNLCELASRAVNLLQSNFQKKGIHVDLEFSAEDIPLYGFAGEILQAILEILQNAGDAFVEQDMVRPRIILTANTQNGKARLLIENNGGAIAPTIFPKIFDPYVSSKNENAGLGLYMAKMIVEDFHDGQLSVSCHDDWTSFLLEFPQEEVNVHTCP